MNKIIFFSEFSGEPGMEADRVAIEIDGKPIYEVLDPESTKLNYSYIEIPHDLEAYFMGDYFPDWTLHGNILVVLDCACGYTGCRPIGCSISLSGDSVIWSNFMNLQTEDCLEGAPSKLEFTFGQYKQAIDDFEVSHKRF
ncbi:hypothetical protein [Microbulbifer hainanensis]|uniref:hypothetical protein n=1 Tax=Microbulbifer hainanensis TaxID=2735675 RepID=UPI001866A6EC|nr:hypothetical protein [Microbulbifer hainanensis]